MSSDAVNVAYTDPDPEGTLRKKKEKEEQEEIARKQKDLDAKAKAQREATRLANSNNFTVNPGDFGPGSNQTVLATPPSKPAAPKRKSLIGY